MAETATTTAERTLVHYQVREGVAYLTLDDPPANTYTHEMMRQLDEAILKARFDKDVHVIVLSGTGEKIFCAGANINMLKTVGPELQVLLLPARQRDAVAARADAQAGDRGAQRPHRRRRPRDRHGGRPAHRQGAAAEVRPARGHARRAPRHRRHAAPGAPRRQVALDRADGHRPAVRVRGGRGARHRQHGLRRRPRGVHGQGAGVRPPVLPAEQGRAGRSAASSARCSPGAEIPFESALTLERELQQQLFQSEDAKEGLAAYVEKRAPQFKAN